MRSRSGTASRSSRRRFWRAPLRRSSSDMSSSSRIMKSFSTLSRIDGGMKPGAVAFARREQLDDVRVTLDALQDLLLHLEPHLVLAAHAALQALDRDRPAQRRLRLDPALLAEVRLREAAAAELDRLPGLVDDERVDPAARHVRRRLAITPETCVIGGPGHLLRMPTVCGCHQRRRCGHRVQCETCGDALREHLLVGGGDCDGVLARCDGCGCCV